MVRHLKGHSNAPNALQLLLWGSLRDSQKLAFGSNSSALFRSNCQEPRRFGYIRSRYVPVQLRFLFSIEIKEYFQYIAIAVLNFI